MRVTAYAVMQPYFFPYEGYFRLLANTDYFVIFDNAQFPRRGRVHRFSYLNSEGQSSWISLSVEKMPRDSDIRSAMLTECAGEQALKRVMGIPKGQEAISKHPQLLELLGSRELDLVQYLTPQIEYVGTVSGATCQVVRSSEILQRCEMNYVDYIIRIGRELGADRYVNLSGGKDLYPEHYFNRVGIDLAILPSFTGSGNTCIQTLLAS